MYCSAQQVFSLFRHRKLVYVYRVNLIVFNAQILQYAKNVMNQAINGILLRVYVQVLARKENITALLLLVVSNVWLTNALLVMDREIIALNAQMDINWI